VRLTLRDVTKGEISRTLVGHTEPVQRLAFSPDGGAPATASGDGTVRLWNVRTGAENGRPTGLTSAALTAVAFSPDGRTVATAGQDGTVRLWSSAPGRRSPC
jgi:WD40 repeat protein